MPDQPVINIVVTRCPPAEDTRFNRWYNEVHIPMLLKSNKVQAVTRFKQVGPPGSGPAFIAIYQFASLKDFQEFGGGPELAAAAKEMRESWGETVEIMSRSQYELIQQWDKQRLSLL
jgi:hypothetical protein